jgi:hypothetical protein
MGLYRLELDRGGGTSLPLALAPDHRAAPCAHVVNARTGHGRVKDPAAVARANMERLRDTRVSCRPRRTSPLPPERWSLVWRSTLSGC